MSDSVDVKLDIVQEMELPKSLKYAEYDSNKIINKSEVQLEDKAYRSYPATSADGNEVEWSIPSIAGGSVRRCLEHEIPVYAQITHKGVEPVFSVGEAPIAIGAQVLNFIFGSSPTPLNPYQNTIDQAPLSKIFGDRSFTINNASTVLTENLDHQEVDMLVSGADIEKMENDNLEPFVTSNICTFDTLARSGAGHILPHGWNYNNDPFSSPLLGEVGKSSLISAVILSRRSRFAGNLASSWASKRNAGRNIIKFEVVSVTSPSNPQPTLSTDVISYENIKCPVPIISSVPQTTVAGYFPTAFTYTFKWTIREQLWSNHWFNDYNYDRNIWNQLMPVSALNVKYTIKQDYLKKAFLQIGDDAAYVIASGNSYSVDNVWVSTSMNELKLNLYSQKVPSHFINQNAYKLMFMDKASKQGIKPVFVDAVDGSGNATIFKSSQEYNNLTQFPEFLQTCLPIQKSVFLKKLYGSTPPSDCTLPSVFNLPITGLQITINDESDLGLFQQDAFQLQKITIDNLQELKYLKDVVVGKSVPYHKKDVDDSFVNSSGGILTSADAVNDYIANVSLARPALSTNERTQPSMPVSCSQFTLLKMGRDVRLPVGMCAGQLITFNMTVTATCDLTKLPVHSGFYDTVKNLRSFQSTDLTQPLANMQNYFYNKKIVTLSGRAFSTVYVHNIYITLNQYKTMLADIKTSFSKLDRDDIFDSRLIMGGSLWGRMKDAVDWVKPKLKKAVDVAKTVTDVTGAPAGVSTGLNLASKALGSGMAEHEVHAGRSENMVTAGKIDWKKMLKS